MSPSVPRTSSRPGSRRERRALTGVLVLGALGAAAATVPGSGAAFTAKTTNPGNVLAAAADWVAPTVSIADPGSPLRGSVPLTATASDSGSGLATLLAQYAPNAGAEASYVTLCTATSSPATCAWDTTKVADGTYKVRATATDKAANAATSAVVSQRVVDNTAPTGTLTDPGTNLAAGTIALSGSAADATSGVAKVVVQRAPTGTTTWTDICTTTPSGTSYGCNWTATAGSYDLRTVVTDAAGNTLTTATLVRRVVVSDTVRPTGSSIVTANGTGTAGTIEQNDTLVLRWSELMNLSTIITGLSETTDVPLTVQVNPTGFLSLGPAQMAFAGTGGRAVNLGTIDLGSASWANLFTGSASFNATARARTVGGATEVVITLGTRISGSAPSAASVKLTWTPSTTPTDVAGNATSTSATPTVDGVAF